MIIDYYKYNKQAGLRRPDGTIEEYDWSNAQKSIEKQELWITIKMVLGILCILSLFSAFVIIGLIN